MTIDIFGNGSFLFQSLNSMIIVYIHGIKEIGATFISVNTLVVNGTIVANTAMETNTVTTNVATIDANTGLTLGSSSIAANGYTYLPNGLLLQWLTCTANSTSKTITWPIVFSNNVLNISGSSNALFTWSCLSSNTTGCNVVTSNTATSALSLTVIGN